MRRADFFEPEPQYDHVYWLCHYEYLDWLFPREQSMLECLCRRPNLRCLTLTALCDFWRDCRPGSLPRIEAPAGVDPVVRIVADHIVARLRVVADTLLFLKKLPARLRKLTIAPLIGPALADYVHARILGHWTPPVLDRGTLLALAEFANRALVPCLQKGLPNKSEQDDPNAADWHNAAYEKLHLLFLLGYPVRDAVTLGCRIKCNLVNDARRQRKRRQKHHQAEISLERTEELMSKEPEPLEQLLRREGERYRQRVRQHARQIFAAIAAREGGEKGALIAEAWRLFRQQNGSFKQIADVLEIDPKTATKYVKRGLAIEQRFLADHPDTSAVLQSCPDSL